MTSEQYEDLIETKTLVKEMHHYLFGNGQPGIIKEIQTKIDRLEKTKSRSEGVLWALSAIVSFIGLTDIIKLFKAL